MASTPLKTPEFRENERRHSPRRRLSRLAYVDFGPENGGILVDVSEGGLHCQVVSALMQGQPSQVKFVLPGMSTAIEAMGKVAWCNATKRGGGLQFVKMGDDARRQLREWILSEEVAARPATDPAALERTSTPETVAAKNVPGATAAGESHADQQSRLALALAASEAPVPHPPAMPERVKARVGIATPAVAVQLPVETPPAPRLVSVRGESFAKSAAEKRGTFQQVAASASRAIRPNLILGAILIALAALATQFGPMLSHLTRGAANSASSAASASALRPTPLFEVDVIDVASRHFTLNNADVGAPPASVTAVAATTPRTPPAAPAPAPARSAPPAPSAAATVRQPSAPRSPSLALLRPRRKQPAPGTIDAASAPAVAENVIAPVEGLSAQPAAPPAFAPVSAAQPTPSGSASKFKPPVLVHQEDPVRPQLAGTVQMKITIDPSGIPQKIAWAGGDSRLTQTAMDTIKRWRYQPATLNGRAVESEAVVTITIALHQ